MLIRDILSLQLDDPLRGRRAESPREPSDRHPPGEPLRRRLPPLRDPVPRPFFDPSCRAEMLAAAARAGVRSHEGVLGAALGPAYETPAELAMVRAAGAQAASMSTFAECILAARLGLPLLAMSCITNEIKEIDQEPVGHEEVVAAGGRAAADFARLLAAWSEFRAQDAK